jgi:hypothetical protein
MISYGKKQTRFLSSMHLSPTRKKECGRRERKMKKGENIWRKKFSEI